ncbi:restriction endonuclease subunit S [Polymorphum gilvum]|uniref:Putative Restriction modification system, type I hsdS n=1 Tax=Polymorphum gilvum (strain LMG 25793 / CGMCC 1.9160 / SL003B-26A1) TaxID=991905 RepID=F2IVN4_POLGS|nr:restriction endonuclease subunit S [Polymorphum gilvum]ADZ69141.1 Putative Restriction modification system, type I hsdS [Polymorphum gilvum SL003B-26A1]
MTMVPIGDVTEVKGGGTPSKRKPEYYQGDIPWVTPKDMKVWDISDAIDKITPEAVADSATNLIPARSILLVNRSGILKHTLPVGITRREVAINQDLKALICSDRAHPEYLAHIVKAAEPIILKWVRATTADNFPIDSLKELKIPLPTLDEQRRIAGILDQADALRRLRSRALDKLNTLGQAIFHEMFGDPATNPKGWPMGVIGDLLKEAKYGSSGKANSEGRGLPMLRMGNVTYDGRIDLSDLKHIELSDKEFDKYTTRPGDLLFNRTNSKELVGKTAVVTQAEPMAIAGYLVRGRANARGNTHYISGYLNSTHGKAVLRNMCKNIVGMANINAKEFQSIPTAIPPVEIQRVYAEKLMSLRAEEAQFQASLDIASTLFASLQHRAFKGEL